MNGDDPGLGGDDGTGSQTLIGPTDGVGGDFTNVPSGHSTRRPKPTR